MTAERSEAASKACASLSSEKMHLFTTTKISAEKVFQENVCCVFVEVGGFIHFLSFHTHHLL
jgi:hypothetical protein